LGFDIVPYRKDIKQADARNLPLKDKIADFIFIDSPYSDNIEGTSMNTQIIPDSREWVPIFFFWLM
jgi:hypothetical protein